MKTGAKNTLRQQGFALVIALAYLLFLSMFATAFLRAVRMNMTDAFNDEARIEATNLARAGIEKAVAELLQNSEYRGEENTPLGDGSFTIEVEALETPSRYRVVSQGRGEAPLRRYAHARIIVELALNPDGTLAALHQREIHRW